MGNEEYFNKVKNLFPSLQTFNIDNNTLTFFDEKSNQTYNLSLHNISLYTMNQSLFSLKPRDIYRVIYMLDLIQRNNSNEQELEFVTQYINKFLKIETKRLNGDDVDSNLIYNMSIPIFLIDDPRPEIQKNIKNMDARRIIEDTLKKHIEESNKGGEALVLRTQYYKENNKKSEMLETTTKNGFTSFILVLITIIFTILYISLFFNK